MADFNKSGMRRLSIIGLVVSFVLLVVGSGFYVYAQLSAANEVIRDDIVIKCFNENCDYQEVLSPDELAKRAEEQFDALKQTNPDTANQLIDETINSLNAGVQESGGITPEMAEKTLMAAWGLPQRDLPFICPKCGQEKVFRAMKCNNCDCIFIPKARGKKGGYVDKCPQCGFSQREQDQKNLRK
ncbi:MAG: hypothetical protein JXD22_07725 [Sedimentisphaerales bacterium]|nr:hypothetical protein [Sedimentisphaerales bacterium]